MSSTVNGRDGKSRCSWCSAASEFFDYHDKEWGYPVSNDIRLFEKLCLESFQSGLSWRTILAKRDNFRSAFHGFDFNKVALFKEKDIERLLADAGIVRHRGKIEAVINNAKCAKEMVTETGSLAAFFWSYEPDEEDLAKPQTASTSEASKTLSKDLKKKGWKFVGPTTVYAFMQAMGLINDHAEGCVFRTEAKKARERFIKPKMP
ncbi:DNA-3-methyladenine glycosylase I [Microbulbifer aggregans]|uniref:DNA-3-methyladenine glycosylase I n=1 Tax=Microbulbifer aggregans TaxID=1769779 RepID=UPI001CFD9914|nr:DNA-3-methyladenine glycosylase I [Microbulbifer aggregans]